MGAHVDSSIQETTELFGARFLLSKLRLGQEPKPPALDLTGLDDSVNLLLASNETAKSIATRITASTMYGLSSPTRESQGLESLREALAIWTLSSLRQYHLEEGARFLRAMAYLGLRETSAFHQGIDFLLEQQNDGYFGFWAAIALKLRSQAPEFDERESLHLPVTTACLWTLAEAAKPSLRDVRQVPLAGRDDLSSETPGDSLARRRHPGAGPAPAFFASACSTVLT